MGARKRLSPPAHRPYNGVRTERDCARTLASVPALPRLVTMPGSKPFTDVASHEMKSLAMNNWLTTICALPLLMLHTTGTARGAEQGVILACDDCEADSFSVGVRLFNNRKYTLAGTPQLLEGMTFLRTAIEGVNLTCVETGTLYALSPTPGRERAASREAVLLEAGFEKVDLPEFQLYGEQPVDRVSVYRKSVAEGEFLSFGKWVVFVAPNLAHRKPVSKPWSENDGELLYNGIRLPKQWPPRHLDSVTRDVPPVPYLDYPPKVIPIDVGRQLFVDDYLIEKTTLRRRFHQPVKYAGNPVLKPETELELNQGFCPSASPFSDGCFYDPNDKLFKLWYHAGFMDGVALAVSDDGLQWRRPELDVVGGTNRVVAQRDEFRRDGVSVWLDHDTDRPEERFKMFYYARTGKIGQALQDGAGYLLTSPNGVHWTWRGQTGPTGDNTTFFYNPFSKTWVFSHRSYLRGRTRSYWEHEQFLAALDDWDGYDPVYWCGADRRDPPHPEFGYETQLYKVDAVAYESLMVGLLQIHYGPPNGVCARGGFPKLTDLKVAFSRDGFHWDRSARETFIGATLEKDSWERAYIHSCGGVCLVVGDKLYFYYGAYQGDESNHNPVQHFNGMYANASTGLAILRRDGFASMDAGPDGGELTTRPIMFQGKYLFVNVDAPKGELRAEAVDLDGTPIKPFTLANCRPLSCDTTLHQIAWRDGDDLSSLSGKPVRLRFHLTNGQLFAFWTSSDRSGASHGYVAAGGPGLTGSTDTQGSRAYPGSATE